MIGIVVEPKRGHAKYFSEYRNIIRGKRQGRIECRLVSGKTIQVTPDSIRRYPELHNVQRSEKGTGDTGLHHREG